MVFGPIEVDGLAELRRSLRAAGESYDDLKEVGLAAGQIVATTAKTIAPRESGALEGSIRAAGQAKGAVVRAGSAAIPYAGPIHFGWPARDISPDPFLYLAADARVGEVTDLYLKRVQEIADNIKGA